MRSSFSFRWPPSCHETARASGGRLRHDGGDSAPRARHRARTQADLGLGSVATTRSAPAESSMERSAFLSTRPVCGGSVSTAAHRRDVSSRKPCAVCLTAAPWWPTQTLRGGEERRRQACRSRLDRVRQHDNERRSDLVLAPARSPPGSGGSSDPPSSRVTTSS